MTKRMKLLDTEESKVNKKYFQKIIIFSSFSLQNKKKFNIVIINKNTI